jgi:RHS repeat-associated protein
MGSLLEENRDAGGLMYMRNRYYDPKTGQFTQSDPIGLGGGLNTYGFAAGDPVSYSDPYGLCVWPPNPRECIRKAAAATARGGDVAVQRWAESAAASEGAQKVFSTGMGLLAALWTSDTYTQTAQTLTIAGAANQIRQNRLNGDGWRDAIAESMEALGFEVQTEVTFQTPFGDRRVDIVVGLNGVTIGLIEAKWGGDRSEDQRRKDEWIRRETGLETAVVQGRP